MPQLGERKTFPNGNVAEFDGKGWRLVGQAEQQQGRVLSQNTATAEKINESGSESSLGDIAVGVGKGIANTGYGLMNIPGITDGPRPEWMQPSNPGQRAGYAFEQGAEYAIPIPGVGAAKLPVKMAAEGARGYVTSKVHGDPDPGLMAAVGAAFPVAEKGVAALGRVVGDSGEGLLRKLISPDPKEVPVKLPYRPNAPNPMDEVKGIRGNSWDEYATKVNDKVNNLDQQITMLYSKPSNAIKQVDVDGALNASLAKPQYSAQMRVQPALARRMGLIVDKWKDELATRSKGTGTLSPADARQFKIDMRTVFNDEFKDAPDASVTGLFQEMYKNVDAAMDAAVPEGAQLNQQFSNAITMREQVERRMNQLANAKAENRTARDLRFPVIDSIAAALNSPAVRSNMASASPYVGMALNWLSKFPGRGVFGLMESTEQDNYKGKKKR